MFGVRPKKHPKIGALRYQLLTAVAGSIAYASAEAADIAVLVIHEFETTKTDDALHEANSRDIEVFLQRPSGIRVSGDLRNEPYEFIGPFRLPDTPLFAKPPPLLVGKIVTDRRLNNCLLPV